MKFRTYALATSAAALLLVLAGCSGMSGDMEGMSLTPSSQEGVS